MANIQSQKKRIRTNEKARLRNKDVKSSLKTAVRKFREAADAGDATAAAALAREANRALTRRRARASFTKTRLPTASRPSASASLLSELPTPGRHDELFQLEQLLLHIQSLTGLEPALHQRFSVG